MLCIPGILTIIPKNDKRCFTLNTEVDRDKLLRQLQVDVHSSKVNKRMAVTVKVNTFMILSVICSICNKYLSSRKRKSLTKIYKNNKIIDIAHSKVERSVISLPLSFFFKNESTHNELAYNTKDVYICAKYMYEREALYSTEYLTLINPYIYPCVFFI